MLSTFPHAYWRILILAGFAGPAITELAEANTAESFLALRCQHGILLDDMNRDELVEVFLSTVMSSIAEEATVPTELYPAFRIAFELKAETYLESLA